MKISQIVLSIILLAVFMAPVATGCNASPQTSTTNQAPSTPPSVTPNTPPPTSAPITPYAPPPTPSSVTPYTPPPTPPSAGSYVGSKNSDKFHKPSCQWAQKISKSNEVWFSSRQDALSKGYQPCKVCKP